MIGPGFLSLFAALAVTLGLLALALYLLRRIQAGPLPRGQGVRLEILQRVSLGPRQGVALLRVADRVLVVSIAETGTRLLTELTDAAREEALQSTAPAPARRPLPGLRLPLLGRIGLIGLLLLTPATLRAQTPPPAPAAAARAQAGATTAPVPKRLQTGGTTAPAPARGARVTAPAPGPSVRPPLPPQVDVRIGEGRDAFRLSGAVGLVVFVGALTLLPVLFLLMTSFTRILIVLHFLRSALGTQTTPPGQLLVALSVLLTGVVMNPVLQEVNRTALQPYFKGQIDQVQAYQTGVRPFRDFMLANTREKDLNLFTELSGAAGADSIEQVPIVTVVAAFVTSELRTAFQMGFVIYLPFVVVDIIVASVLMSLGMFMLPPPMISLPFKLLLFVLADGWTLVVQNLVSSFR